MREALARSDLDFVIAEEPPRRKTRAAPKGPPRPAPSGRMRLITAPFAFLMRRPGRTILCAAGAALVTGIVLNAVLFQTGRHPAPLFGGASNVAAAKPATPPMPAPRPANIAMAAPAAPAPAPRAAEAPAPMRAAEAAPAPVAAPAPPVSKKDPIGALIHREGISEPSAPPARVAAVQKALIRTGFVLRADGVMGATTRQALERFEQERNLPVTGDLSPRTLRELAAQSGVAIP